MVSAVQEDRKKVQTMGICSECLHFDVCNSWHKELEEEGLATGRFFQHKCKDFKNKADVVEVDKISEALADLFDAPCNFSPTDEWLPYFCDFKYECNCESKECWKQFFKHYSKKECAK